MSQFSFSPLYIPNIHILPRFSIILFPPKIRNAENILALAIDALSFQIMLVIQEK